MASTNKTTNYELSQFLGTDKPAWLGDYNPDMLKIDNGIHNAQVTATGADGKATANATAIGDISALQTTAKNNLVEAINEIDTETATAQNIANSAQTTANSANTKATNALNALNLNVFTTLTWTASFGTIASNTTKVATNSDGSLAKIYGFIRMTDVNNPSATVTLTSSDTGLRPESAINFQACGNSFKIFDTSPATGFPSELNYTLNTDGTITCNINNSGSPVEQDITFLACLLFISDFGD